MTRILGSGGRYDKLIKEFGLDVPATGFALDIDLAHKAASKSEIKESFKILLNCKNDKKSIELIKIATKLRCSDIIVELCFEKIPDIESFAREKKYNMLVEAGQDFKNITVTDLDRNIKIVKKIDEFIKEFKDEERN